jgi:hypothetical protein
VVIGVDGPRGRVKFASRYDLPDPPDATQSADIAEHVLAVLRREHVKSVVVVGYGTGRLVTPVADLLRSAMRRAGIKPRDVLRVEDGRYWSYVCRDPHCCPPEGVAYDAVADPAAVALSDAGLTAHPDRAALASTLATSAGAAAPMRAATDRALRRAEELVREATSVPGGGDALRLVIDAGRRAVKRAIGVYRGGGTITDHDQVAWLAVSLADLRVRDDAWARMDPEFRAAHRRLWTDVVRLAPLAYVPAPAALLAFTAWQAGEGALASIAIERAVSADPGYSMAILLARAVQAGLPPSAARLPMTPEEVAASYAGTERRGAAALGRPGRAASGSRPGRAASGSRAGATRARSRPSG